MKNRIFGLWDVCCTNCVLYCKSNFLGILPSRVLIFELRVFYFSPPFTAYNQKELAEKIREGKHRRIPYRYSEELNALLSKMLNLKVDILKLASCHRNAFSRCYRQPAV